MCCFYRLTCRFSPRRRVLGLTVVVRADRRSDVEPCFAKATEALRLIWQVDRRRFARLRTLVDTIIVFGDPTALGYWRERLRMIELQAAWVAAPATSAAEVACTIVHEAMHARLDRLGFGYREPDRLRIERVCFHAARAFAARLPDGADLAAEHRRRMTTLTAEPFSNAARRQALGAVLREMGCPAILLRWADRRAARRERNERTGR